MTNTASVEAHVRNRSRSDRPLLAAAALLFVVSATATVQQCAAMATMPGMAMPGGWQMSMMWMRMPGQSAFGAALAFVAMWTTMMAAMMLPSLLAMLHRYRAASGSVTGARLDGLTAIVATGYFTVWTALGIVVCATGFVVASLLMHWPMLSRAAPLVSGLVVVAVGAAQFSTMKARQLDCCARSPRAAVDTAGAWRQGVRFGLACCRCCAGFTLLLLVCGAMDLIVMSVVTAAISAERLAPPKFGIARAIGAIVMAAGLLTMLQASGVV